MIAMGGNSISPKSRIGTVQEQFKNSRKSLDAISHFIKRGYNLCINHGNGPQVGNELLRMDLTYKDVPPLPLGICVAGTQGTIGYMIQQSLQNKLRDLNIDREVVTMVTQVIVDKNDPEIQKPKKFIGKRYLKEEALKLSKLFNWKVKEQEPGLWRRVVPSPMPEYIMHGKSIRSLVEKETIIIASGGGGIPVYNNKEGYLSGLDAVIDKDYTAAKMGHIIRAQELWIITDVDNVYKNFGTKKQEPVFSMTVNQAKKLYEEDYFQEGSIGPKIKAALHFLKHRGERVMITSIACIEDALNGQAGTEIRK